ncbi:hypothetical protein [Glycomyces artemisiae]|uniref:Uncharacterized protein n=1 Tax=Glycomyces artemisiae TaxID=1076443 RepID=A0A2T0U6G4_9ACTN|nr:hypothetical protein [Glycomyces artemisiae]PRY53513.1 hypothetical protein B0I28_11712 [Glycomyces artemisiae]
MTTTTATQTKAPAAIDPAALYAKWTDAAKDVLRRYSSASVSEVGNSHAAARAWKDGAANLYVAEDLAAYLIGQMQAESTSLAARETYADMLNDLYLASEAPAGEVAELRAALVRLEAELAELRARLDGVVTD